MKKILFPITLGLLIFKAQAGACPKPNEYAASAFKIIETSTGSDLKNYLSTYTVGRTALNEACEDMYMLSLKKRNEGARQVLEKIGYGPKNKEEINLRRYQIVQSYYEYALAYSPVSVIQDFELKGGESYRDFMQVGQSNTPDVVDWFLARKKATPDGLLPYAVSSNSIEVIDQLIRKGADPSAENILLGAIRRQNFEIVKLLVRSGADINKVSGAYSNMCYAVVNDTPEIYTFLKLAGGNISDPQVIFTAVANGKLEIVKDLIAEGVSVQQRYEGGKNLLMKAAGYVRSQPLMIYLVSQGIDLREVDDLGDNVLTYAVLDQTVRTLVDLGADLEQKNKLGLTPLMTVATKYPGMVKTLIKAGANFSRPTPTGDYPINLAIGKRKSCVDPLPAVQALIEAGARINQKSQRGYTPLMEAAMLSDCSNTDPAIRDNLILYLIAQGADKGIKNYRETARSLYSTYYGRTAEILELLNP
jgi:ankyrin repeat protein